MCITVGTITLLVFIAYYDFGCISATVPELLGWLMGSMFSTICSAIEFLDSSNICWGIWIWSNYSDLTCKCSSDYCSNLNKIRFINCFSFYSPVSRLYLSTNKENLFLTAFYVRPFIPFATSDHFFKQFNSKTLSRSFTSYWTAHGPFFISGFT